MTTFPKVDAVRSKNIVSSSGSHRKWNVSSPLAVIFVPIFKEMILWYLRIIQENLYLKIIQTV